MDMHVIKCQRKQYENICWRLVNETELRDGDAVWKDGCLKGHVEQMTF